MLEMTKRFIIYQIKNNKSDFSPIARNYSTTQFAAQPFKILVKSEVSNPFYETLKFVTYGKQF